MISSKQKKSYIGKECLDLIKETDTEQWNGRVDKEDESKQEIKTNARKYKTMYILDALERDGTSKEK